MSDTPRTDAATERMDDDHGTPCLVVPVKVAKKLERESDRLAKQCVRNVEEIGTLRAEVAILGRERDGARACLKSWEEDEGADAKRLEWLMKSSFVEITREEIDCAMEAANNE